MQRIITLTTDFGYKDYYVGSLKGKIYSNIPSCNIVDISHNISHYNVEEAGFVIAAAYKNFPKGSIHIIAVDATITEFSPAICLYYQGHYFITADNGILTLLLQQEAKAEVVLINPNAAMKSSNDVFVYCAYQLFEGKALEEIGTLTQDFNRLNRLGDALEIHKDGIQGKIVYEDSFGNLVSNITKADFEKISQSRNFEIIVKDYRIKRINRYYCDFTTSDSQSLKERAGEFVAVFNDLDLLTIGLFYSRPNTPGGSPRTLMNIQLYDNISIVFQREEDQ